MATARTDREQPEPREMQIEESYPITVSIPNVRSQMNRREECVECGATIAHYSHCIRYA